MEPYLIERCKMPNSKEVIDRALGITMDAMIEFTNANYVNFKAWYENREVKSNAKTQKR